MVEAAKIDDDVASQSSMYPSEYSQEEEEGFFEGEGPRPTWHSTRFLIISQLRSL